MARTVVAVGVEVVVHTVHTVVEVSDLKKKNETIIYMKLVSKNMKK